MTTYRWCIHIIIILFICSLKIGQALLLRSFLLLFHNHQKLVVILFVVPSFLFLIFGGCGWCCRCRCCVCVCNCQQSIWCHNIHQEWKWYPNRSTMTQQQFPFCSTHGMTPRDAYCCWFIFGNSNFNKAPLTVIVWLATTHICSLKSNTLAPYSIQCCLPEKGAWWNLAPPNQNFAFRPLNKDWCALCIEPTNSRNLIALID